MRYKNNANLGWRFWQLKQYEEHSIMISQPFLEVVHAGPKYTMSNHFSVPQRVRYSLPNELKEQQY